MGRPLPPLLDDDGQPIELEKRDWSALYALFSEEELAAARRLVIADRLKIDLIALDPAGQGWSYLRRAMICLRGRDPGRLYRNPARRQALRDLARRRGQR